MKLSNNGENSSSITEAISLASAADFQYNRANGQSVSPFINSKEQVPVSAGTVLFVPSGALFWHKYADCKICAISCCVRQTGRTAAGMVSASTPFFGKIPIRGVFAIDGKGWDLRRGPRRNSSRSKACVRHPKRRQKTSEGPLRGSLHGKHPQERAFPRIGPRPLAV